MTGILTKRGNVDTETRHQKEGDVRCREDAIYMLRST